MRTLILDNAYLPVKIVSWQKAMTLYLSQRAEVVTEYADKTIRSVSKSFKLPKILRLYGKHRGRRVVRFTRTNVFLRDNNQCQYCTIKFDIKDLTLDHVIPSSKGGDTSWENIVTCCARCNIKKGNKYLREIDMKLLKKPKAPKWSPKVYLRVARRDPDEWNAWLF